MSDQDTLVTLLKKKGIGPTMSKPLDQNELKLFSHCLTSPQAELVTKATLLSAFLTLPRDDTEQQWFDSASDVLPEELRFLLRKDPEKSILKQGSLIAISGEDLDLKTSKACFKALLDTEEKDVLKASFLEAIRIKRESFEENLSCWDVLWDFADRATVKVDQLCDLSFAYDGFNRTANWAPFVAAVLSATGLPTVLHGVETLAPKFGLTCHQLLKAAGKSVDSDLERVSQDIENKDVAWGFIDQSQSFPTLYELSNLRKLMVKRSLLATFEKLLQPLRSNKENILVTSYTHPPYKTLLSRCFQSKKRWNKSLILRGLEGSPQLPLDRRSPYTLVSGDHVISDFQRPSDYGIDEKELSAPSDLLDYSLDQGLSALKNKSGQIKNSITYLSSVILKHSLNLSPIDAVNRVEAAINSGKALSMWDNGAIR